MGARKGERKKKGGGGYYNSCKQIPRYLLTKIMGVGDLMTLCPSVTVVCNKSRHQETMNI